MANVYPLVVEFESKNVTFVEHIQRVEKRFRDLEHHVLYPLAKVLQELHVDKRDLYTVEFNLLLAKNSKDTADSVVQKMFLPQQVALNDLVCWMEPCKDYIHGEIKYSLERSEER